MRDFKDLDVWKSSKQLAIDLYKSTEGFGFRVSMYKIKEGLKFTILTRTFHIDSIP
jgi:hypothetical protein